MLRSLSRSRVVTPVSYLLLAGQLALVAPVLAQGKPSTAPAPAAPAAPGAKAKPLAETLQGDAKANYDLGITLYKVGDHANAYTRFKQAYDEAKEPRLLWNMAACQKWLRHYSQVQTLVNSYVKDGGEQGLLSEQDFREARELLTVVDSLVGPLKIQISEPGASVAVDGIVVATTPLDGPLSVDMGTRHIKISKPEFKDFEADVNVTSGKEAILKVNLIKITHEGRISVRTSEKTSIIAVDGKKIGSYEFFGAVPVGSHLLRVTAPGFEPFQADFALTEGGMRTFEVTLKAEKKPIPLWVWIGGGVLLAGGLAAASVGAAFAFRSDRCDPSGTTVCPSGTLGMGNGEIQVGASR